MEDQHMEEKAEAGKVEDSEADLPVKDQKFYTDAKEYWDSVNPTIDGMLGGYAKISPTDINGSRAFMRPLLKIGGGKTGTQRALDCGAGIGRITKRLLLPMFETVDMVELSQKFCDAAREFIGKDSSRVDRIKCCGLQDFTPEPGRYDVIWCQWVLSHLRDDDLVAFLRRCQMGLAKNGVIIVKENIGQGDSLCFDEQDSSFVRTRDHMEKVLLKSGMEIIRQEKQKGFPKDIFSVYMYALWG
ncbi:N-terminal Xaa-Pro-Lys N-methyltransferase 1-like [Littorina saxatilis]|uniref:Alpha N-terminal protein methyltransferase 1 n=1 Tax=Littorina saxatilis TaxID=31220 RepID=A0AAN9AXM8_9CAEN